MIELHTHSLLGKIDAAIDSLLLPQQQVGFRIDALGRDHRCLFLSSPMQEIDLCSLLPEGWKFQADDLFVTRPPYKEVAYDRKRLNNSEFFVLSIFHEIGHANNDPHYLMQAELSLDDLVKIKNGESIFPRDEIRKKLDCFDATRPQRERDAWAYAVKMIRRLRCNDSLSNNDVRKFMGYHLLSYDVDSGNLKKQKENNVISYDAIRYAKGLFTPQEIQQIFR